MSDYQKPELGDQYGTEPGAYDNTYDAPPEKTGMSGCLKVFLIFGGLGIVALLVCCVGGGLYLRSAATREPAEIREIASRILDWEFNDELDPQVGVDLLGAFRIAVFVSPDKGMIMMFDTKFATDAKQMAQGMQGQVNQGNAQAEMSEETEIIEEGQEPVEIKGQIYDLEFNKSRGKDSGQEYWEVFGIVPGEEFGTVLTMKLLADVYDKETILERLRNLD